MDNEVRLKSTIGLAKKTEKLSAEYIAELAMSHAPESFESEQGRLFAEQSLSKVLPIYDAAQNLSAVIRMNNVQEVSNIMASTDIDTLLVCYKAAAFYMSKGDDAQILNNFQRRIIEAVQNREAGKEEAPKKKKSKALPIILCIILVIALAVGAVFAINYFGKKNKNNSSNSADKKKAEMPIEETIEDGQLLVEFYPNIEVTGDELEDAAESIKDRISVLNVDYNVEFDDEKILLYIDEDFAETPKQKEYILKMIATTGKFSVGWGFAAEMEDCKDGFSEIEVESEEKEKFLRYMGDKLNETTKEALEAADMEEINYLHITLDKTSGIEFRKFAEEIDAKSKSGGYPIDIIGMFDYVMHRGVDKGVIAGNFEDAGFIIKVSDKDELFLLPGEDVSGDAGCLEVLKYILQTDSMATSFGYTVLDEPEWEDDEKVFSEYQEKDIKGKHIVAKFNMMFYGTDEEQAEKYEKAIDSIKSRIDALEIPFAFGYCGLDGKDIALKISPEYLNSDMIRFLTYSKEMEIYSRYGSTYLDISDVEIFEDENDEFGLKLQFGSFQETQKDEIFAKFARTIPGATMEAGNKDVLAQGVDVSNENAYLVVNDVTIAGAKLGELQDDLTLSFSNLLCFEKDSMSEEDMLFLETLQLIYEEPSNAYSTMVESVKYYDKNGDFVTEDISEIPWGYDGSEVREKDKEIIEDYGAKVSKSIKKRNSLVIELDVDEDKDFGTKFMNQVKEIYKKCYFDDCSYANIEFREKDAVKSHPENKAEISFYKSSSGDMTGMTASGVFFDGPTYKKYKEEVTQICETDDFFAVKTGAKKAADVINVPVVETPKTEMVDILPTAPKEYKKGILTETTYESEFIGVKYTAPSGWINLSEAELAEQIATTELVTWELMSLDIYGKGNVLIGIERVPINTTLDMFIDGFSEGVSGTIKKSKEEILENKSTAMLAGKEYTTISYQTQAANGDEVIQTAYARKEGEHFIMILFTVVSDVNIQDILNSFVAY